MKFSTIMVATKDDRGHISDILHHGNYQHAAIIESYKGETVRGNHYHKETTQYIYVLKGALVYWWQPFDKSEPVKSIFVGEGDLVETPPYEVHALDILTPNQFIVFSNGPRGGDDYESDTFRVDPILTQDMCHYEGSPD